MLQNFLSFGFLLAVVFAELQIVEKQNLTSSNVGLPPYMGNHINIHMVPHTHDDTGWLMPTDEYYIEEVQWIFDTMVPVLQGNPNRKFTYVEMAYFWRWWNEQNMEMQQAVLELIDANQLQINLGGWCMNDEADPIISAIVHQMTDGAQFVLHNFGENARPTVGWHVDPFGHSWVTGGLWAEVGFDCFGINRINYMDLEVRKANQNLEFVWKGSTSLGDDGYIWVHILDSGYCTPSEIDFTSPGNGVNIQTDPRLPTLPTNYVEIAQSFLQDARNRVSWYRHNHILIPYGCDFAHQNAYYSMYQMDSLIEYINSNNTYNATIFYSTLADYTKAVNNLNLVWPVEDIDFFDYIDNPHSWWTGYFTSRPYLKMYVRSRENDLRLAEQLYLFARGLKFPFNETAAMNNITYLRYAIDTTQHHDAVTGTETTDTTQDYMTMLERGTTKTTAFTEQIAGYFLQKGKNVPNLQRGTGLFESLTENNYLAMVVYNSLPWPITELLQIPFNRSDIVVYDISGNIIPSQVTRMPPQAHPFEYDANFTLNILAVDLLPMAFTTFFIGVNPSKAQMSKIELIDGAKNLQTDIKIGSGAYTLYFDADSHLLVDITNNEVKKSFSVHNTWAQYVPAGGIYSDNLQNSGAYIFRPAQDNRYCVNSQNDNNLVTTITNRDVLTSTTASGFIVATHSSTSYTDTFAGKICDVNIEGNEFSFIYYRKDSNTGWGQSPYFDWIVFDSTSDNYYLYNKFFGSIAVTASNTIAQAVTVTFPKNTFSARPFFLASVRSSSCSNFAEYSITVGEVSATQATVYIARIDTAAAWNENVNLDWLAWLPEDNTDLYTQGEIYFQIPANVNSVQQLWFTFNNTNFVVHEPVVLYSLQQVSPPATSATSAYYVATTATNNNATGFGLNLLIANPASTSTIVTYRMVYWAFERRVLYHPISDNVTLFIQRGPLIDQITQVFQENYAQTFTVFNTNHTAFRYIDNQVHLGPMDTGAEFVTRFATSLNNNLTWYTGQNAVEYVTRVYNPYQDERISSNAYPCSSQSYMADQNDDYRFSTIVNMAHSVGSVIEGAYELMLHRRCLSDDGRGVGQVLNETTHIEPSIYILMDETDQVSFLNRHLVLKQQFKPISFYTLTSSIQQYVNTYETSFSAMGSLYQKSGIPVNVNLLSLRYAYSGNVENGGLIMQFEQLFEDGENPQYSTNVTIDVNEILNSSILTINSFTETTLTANLPLSELHRLPWIISENGQVRKVNTGETFKRRLQSVKDTEVTLSPRDIRTFVVNEDMSRSKRSGLDRIPRTQDVN